MELGVDWDMLFGLLQGLAGLYLAYLGVQSTVNPRERFIFIAVGLVFVALGAWQAYRGNQSQQTVQTKLSAIQEETKQISSVLLSPQFNVPPVQAIPERKERSIVNLDTQFVTGRNPPFTSTNSFIINVRYANVSLVPARVTGVWASIYAFDHQLRADEEDRFYASLRESSKGDGKQDNVLGPSQAVWFTIEPKPALNDDSAARLAEGKLYIYITTLVIYSDSSGSHETDLCRFFWGVHPSVHQCYSHNGPRT